MRLLLEEACAEERFDYKSLEMWDGKLGFSDDCYRMLRVGGCCYIYGAG
jgi:hypothetical protein